MAIINTLTLTPLEEKRVGKTSVPIASLKDKIQSEPKQTCLEKIGFKERKRLRKENLDNDGYINGEGLEYSARHKNAISQEDKIKGKGVNSGGHTFFQPNYGKPKENPNEINYSNFLTISDKSQTIGGKIDIDTRYESFLRRRYNYENNEYSDRNLDALSNGDVLGKGTSLYLDTTNGGGGYDLFARDEQLQFNKWRNDLGYTKALVNAEYAIQSEIEISSQGDYEDIEEFETDDNNSGYSKTKAKAERKEKKAIKEEREKREAEKEKLEVEKTKPKEVLLQKPSSKKFSQIINGETYL